ncbi:hypothetical protein ADICEAN_03986 [Cesiribacter andamanensis AMV16]|uniref:Uncharacterized protein n=1 Tax=Cesiribacter andamanensis AMV16 TaxID=1279009 RepID=M7N101_9BACT|nr:hypothetical protein ADICEAN_03986 [Cesiribacter andamanensis AMV16]
MALGFAQGFLQVFLQAAIDAVLVLAPKPGAGHGVSAQQGLVDQVLVVGIGGAVLLQAPVALLPLLHQPDPLLGQIAQNVQAGPHILAPFGIMGRKGVKGQRPLLLALLHVLVKLPGRDIKHLGRITHLIVGHKAVVGIHQGIFYPLGHKRAGKLHAALVKAQGPLVIGSIALQRLVQQYSFQQVYGSAQFRLFAANKA